MKKERNYKIKLNEKQMNTIYTITNNKKKQSKLMSICQYCIKYSDKETGVLTKTISRLFTMYSVNNFKYHNRISRKYFYTLVNLLIDYKLVCVHKIVHKIVHKTEVVETAETTRLDSDSQKPNNLMTNHNTYTPYTSDDIKINALDLVAEVFKDFKIKSKIIKSMVIAKLQNVKLDATGAIAYIVKVIKEKTEQYNNMRVEYAKAVANSKYSKSKNTFVAPKIKARTFNNFKPREYDYDALEKKLLGWE